MELRRPLTEQTESFNRDAGVNIVVFVLQAQSSTIHNMTQGRWSDNWTLVMLPCLGCKAKSHIRTMRLSSWFNMQVVFAEIEVQSPE